MNEELQIVLAIQSIRNISVRRLQMTYVVNVPCPLVGSVPACAVLRYCGVLTPWLFVRYCEARNAGLFEYAKRRCRIHLEEFVDISVEARDSSTSRQEREDIVGTVRSGEEVPTE